MKFVNLASFGPLLLGLLVGVSLGALLGYFGQCASGTCPLTSTWWRGALYGGFMGVLFALSPPRSGKTGDTPPPTTAEVEATTAH
ncbi:MAG: DUF6132 family protein [Chthoniobacterales bacterium]